MALDSVFLVDRAVTALIFCFVFCFAAGAIENDVVGTAAF
jgi:hypothetical protein